MAHEDTAELPTFTRAVGGTDPHPVTVEALIGQIDSQLDVVWAAAERWTPEGVGDFAAAVHELVLLAQSLEGRASERGEQFRATAAVLGSGDDAYVAAMSLLDEGGRS